MLRFAVAAIATDISRIRMQQPHKRRRETLLGAPQQAPDYAEIEARLLAMRSRLLAIHFR
jgi:hypothetical protein